MENKFHTKTQHFKCFCIYWNNRVFLKTSGTKTEAEKNLLI